MLNHCGDHRKDRFELLIGCTAHCQEGYLDVGYMGKVVMQGRNAKWPGGDIIDMYEGGAKRNIAIFHNCIIGHKLDNSTVEPSIDAALATILGREAAAGQVKRTWAEMMAESRRLEPNLEGLKA